MDVNEYWKLFRTFLARSLQSSEYCSYPMFATSTPFETVTAFLRSSAPLPPPPQPPHPPTGTRAGSRITTHDTLAPAKPMSAGIFAARDSPPHLFHLHNHHIPHWDSRRITTHDTLAPAKPMSAGSTRPSPVFHRGRPVR